MTHPLQWVKKPVLNDGFICLVDHMGDDSSIVQAARVSYGKDEREEEPNLDCKQCEGTGREHFSGGSDYVPPSISPNSNVTRQCNCTFLKEGELHTKDRNLIRYLLNHGHTTPFEMVEIKFMVRVPMDCWRQWIRHRTASVNEYSTRYTEAIDSQQTTSPEEWRLQATDNKQGSSGFLEDWPEDFVVENDEIQYKVYTSDGELIVNQNTGFAISPGEYLSKVEQENLEAQSWLYRLRLTLGIAKEQARKDLPLSTYTEAYWKCDLHNIFNFLRLRMDSHAQLEIRQYANAMFEIVKGICPVACEAFEDYVLNAKKFSAMEMEVINKGLKGLGYNVPFDFSDKPDSMSDREWKEFLAKIS